MKEFLYKLISKRGGICLHRLIGLWTMLSLFIIVIGGCFGTTHQTELIYSLTAIIAGVTGFKTLDNIKGKNGEESNQPQSKKRMIYG